VGGESGSDRRPDDEFLRKADDEKGKITAEKRSRLDFMFAVVNVYV